MENFKWCIDWMQPTHGGSGAHYSYAETLEEAIRECKQEYMYNHYTGEVIRPDLKITDVWRFVQYGEQEKKSVEKSVQYRDFLTLTDDEVKFIVKEMFNPTEISDIQRDEEEREITCMITTDGWEDGETKNFSVTDVLTLKQPTLYSPGIFIDFAVGAEEIKKWRQFCLAKGCNAYLEDNPYLN